jgi:Ser/Thr protein kinase RdoA (MazF antagonist)
MYRPGQSEASIRYELNILHRLHAQDWPVAAAFGEPVCHSGRIFALFPRLPGRPHETETAKQARHRGRLLAKLHRELESMRDLGQRPGWTTAVEIAKPIKGELTGAIARYREAVTNRLRASGASSFPMMVVHGDFIAQNLLFQDETLAGILDFDCVHLDLRAADVACARRSGNDDVVRGYLELIPLTVAELETLDDLWRAAVLRYALQIHDGELAVEKRAAELQWCVKQLEKTVPFKPGRG